MAEYIDREALKEHIGSYAGMFTDELGFAVSLQAVLNGVDFAPAADVVEVVRCRDCKHCTSIEGVLSLCAYHYIACDYNDFCSYGERKE